MKSFMGGIVLLVAMFIIVFIVGMITSCEDPNSISIEDGDLKYRVRVELEVKVTPVEIPYYFVSITPTPDPTSDYLPYLTK